MSRRALRHHMTTAMLWVECKQPSGSIPEVEAQALDVAKACIKADDISFMYAMTTVGLSFRVWFYQKGGSALIPCHGEPTNGARL